jgi:hypothetical protein
MRPSCDDSCRRTSRDPVRQACPAVKLKDLLLLRNPDNELSGPPAEVVGPIAGVADSSLFRSGYDFVSQTLRRSDHVPSYNIFGADESITLIEFDDDAGQHKSWAAAKAAAIADLKQQLGRYTGVFVQDLRYVRMRKLLTHLQGCDQPGDYQWRIRFQDFQNPDVAFPMD